MKEKLRHIFLVLTPAEKRQFWIQIVLNILISIADIASLALLLLVISFYINNSVSKWLRFLPQWMLEPGSITLIAIFFVFFCIKNVAGILISNLQFTFIGQIAVRISTRKLNNYLQGNYHEFIQVDSTEHIRKIAFQPLEFSQHIILGIQEIIIQILLILLTLSTILIYNAKLFLLLFLILLPPVAVVFLFIKRKVAAGKKNIHASNERSFRYLLDALTGYVESNIYQGRNFFLHRFATARQQFNTYLLSSLAIQAMPGRIIESFAVLGLFVLIAIAKWSGVNDSSALITIGAFMAAAYKIIPAIVKTINAIGQMRTYDLSIYDVAGDKYIEVNTDNLALKAIQSLELRNVSFSYDGHCILDNFSFCCKGGDFIGISGKSGRGKTTILNLLLGFLPSSGGEILINGQLVTTEELKKYWSSISYVKQQSFLIHDTVLKNVVLSDGQPDEARLEHALSISGVKEFLTGSADGLNKIVHESGKNISGGQQQRINIARALYKNSNFIALDEPFNELDEESIHLLVRHLSEIADKGKIVIMVTHDSKCLSFCNKVISMDEK